MLLSLNQVGDDNDTGRRCNLSVAGRGNVRATRHTAGTLRRQCWLVARNMRIAEE